jgi:hypothetical protein
VQGPGHAAMYDLALMLAETRNWFEPFRRYEPFQAKFWHAASENRPISKEQYRCWHIICCSIVMQKCRTLCAICSLLSGDVQ